MQRHHLGPGDCHIVQNDMPSRPVWDVYRPDGALWVKLVASFRTKNLADAYADAHGWRKTY